MNEKHDEDKPFTVRLVKAAEEDVQEPTKVMKKAFDDDVIRFRGDPDGGGPPGYDDGSFLMTWGIKGDGRYPPGHLYKISVTTDEREESVGAFIVFLGSDVGNPGNNVLGTIFVDPDWQNHGIGSHAMQYIFSAFPGKRWELGTPEWATRNHHFYEKNGFVKIKEVLDSHLDEEKGGAYSYIYERIMGS